MKKLPERYQRLLFFAACMLFVIAGGIYYFGILQAFVPNSEDLSGTIQRWYLILKYGQPYRHTNILTDLIACLSVMAGGMSYFSRRLDFTIWYIIVLGLSLYLSLKSRRRWFVLPVWAFFMIFVHTIHVGDTFGANFYSSDLVYMLPYNYHLAPLVFALISMIILQCFLCVEEKKKRMIIGVIGAVTGIYAFLCTDLLYDVMFVAPLLIVLALRALYHEKTRKYVLPFLAVCTGILLLTRILPGAFFDRLWSIEPTLTPYTEIYGSTDWLRLDNMWTYIMSYVRGVMILFNIDISNRPVISLHSVLFVVRIVFVYSGYVIVARVIACSVKGKGKQSGYGMVDELLAWAFLILSCAFAFTRNALNENQMRYYNGLVPLLTILLCRNIDGYLKGFLPVVEKLRNKKIYFAGIVSALCICQAEPVWRYSASDSYRGDLEAAVEYLRQWGAEADGYGLASYWVCARLSAMTNGEILFYDDEQKIKEIYGEDAVIKYVVIGFDDHRLLNCTLNGENYDSYEEMSEGDGLTVRRAVELDSMYVCEFLEE